MSRKADARALYEADYSLAKIAALLHQPVETIHAWVHEGGDYQQRPWAPAEDVILRELYAIGSDAATIGKQLGRSRADVAARVKESSLTIASTVRAKRARSSDRGMTAGGNAYSTMRRGKRGDIGPMCFKSAWEANIARWLTYSGRRWEYETKTFWFEKIRRGVRSYTPDFYLPDEDLHLEVKGWMDRKSKTKLKRMAKYYPEVKIEVIDRKRYREIATYAAVIPNWERPAA